MPKPLDLNGLTIGDLVILGRSPSIWNSARWVCRCKCGKKFTAEGSRIKRKRVVSCGCKKKARAGALNRTHGLSSSSEHKAWCGMKSRCSNPKCCSFPNYGARGIRVCDEWINDFARFYADMGPKPSPDHTIERIDVNGDYCSSNCCWLHKSLQNKNKRSSTA